MLGRSTHHSDDSFMRWKPPVRMAAGSIPTDADFVSVFVSDGMAESVEWSGDPLAEDGAGAASTVTAPDTPPFRPLAVAVLPVTMGLAMDSPKLRVPYECEEDGTVSGRGASQSPVGDAAWPAPYTLRRTPTGDFACTTPPRQRRHNQAAATERARARTHRFRVGFRTILGLPEHPVRGEAAVHGRILARVP